MRGRSRLEGVDPGPPPPVGRPVAAAVLEFIGDTAFLVHQATQHSLICGTGVLDVGGAEVRFYQKDPDHEGRDVRIWRLEATDTGVTARHDAAI